MEQELAKVSIQLGQLAKLVVDQHQLTRQMIAQISKAKIYLNSSQRHIPHYGGSGHASRIRKTGK